MLPVLLLAATLAATATPTAAVGPTASGAPTASKAPTAAAWTSRLPAAAGAPLAGSPVRAWGLPVRVAAPGAGWGWPLDPEPAVVASFRAPPTPWGAGHRGVDLAAAVGQPVLSAGGGRVTFAGSVAGRGVVVVTHRGGIRTSYEPVDHRVAVGTAVARGDPVGRVSRAGVGLGHCAPRTCLHWGVRQGSRYVDPLTLMGRGPPVLLPLR